MPFVGIALIVFLIWLIVLTIGLGYVFPFFHRLTKAGKNEDIKLLLMGLLKEEEGRRERIAEITGQIERLEKDGLSHVQKVGLIRFNPFSEAGGDHSFSLALLDAKGDGFVITGLHTRERTRIYMKPVTKGKSGLTLSLEEAKAIEKAQKS